ncbi:kinase-like domain-containing protein [Flammula alnicola]|nr:kinase-like domain-containing protein [Flammula alnicola]
MEICDSEAGDGCGLFFPRKVSPGLCAKCSKLASLDEASPDYAQWKAYRQCESCGIAWKNLASPKCGRCSSTTQQPVPGDNTQDLARTAIETSRAARSHAMDARLTKQPITAPTLHTTAGLTSAKNSMTTGENKIFIKVECRIKSPAKKDQKSTDFDCEVLDDYLITLNAHWAKQEGRALIRDEVEFRWAGNKIFLPGTANNTVGEVYNLYQTGEMALYYQSETRTKKAAGSRPQFEMALEIYIDKPAFVIRKRKLLQAVAFNNSSIPGRKRSATTSEYREDVPHQKRHASAYAVSGGVPPSTFVRTKHASNSGVDTSTVIQLKKAHTTCDKETGEVEIGWPENGQVYEGLLGKEVFASGATKNVYKLSIGSDHYVAKRFFEIGSDAEVTASENKDHLEKELIRLKTAAWFLNKFKSYAKECGVEFSADVTVSDGFLICEIGEPSPASSLPPCERDGAIWLIEPCRTKSVQKFSGTMVYPNRHDKLGKTLAAFTHFVYESSGQEIVIADIQGSPMSIGDSDTLVIFDPMSHSHSSDSGIGDHGPEGIKTFIAQHECNYICKGLKLVDLLDEDARAEKEGEDDQEDSEA